MSRREREQAWTHTYVGPDTRYGLRQGTACRIIGKRAGGKMIATKAGRFLVNAKQLEVRNA